MCGQARYSRESDKIMNFGAFVEFAPGKEGLVHISKLDRRVARVEDVCKVGDEMLVKVLDIDKQGASTFQERRRRRTISKKALI